MLNIQAVIDRATSDKTFAEELKAAAAKGTQAGQNSVSTPEFGQLLALFASSPDALAKLQASEMNDKGFGPTTTTTATTTATTTTSVECATTTTTTTSDWDGCKKHE